MNGFNFEKESSHIKVCEIIGKGKRIVEFGCGKGFVSEQLKKQGNSVTGIEMDSANAGLAKKFCEKIIIGNIENLDFKKLGKEFDTALFGDVLEHLRNPEEILRKTGGVLKKNGKVIASLPNIANWKIRLKLLSGKFDYAEQGILDRTHVRFFTLENAKRLFEENGFVIENVSFVPSAPVPGKALKKMLVRIAPGLFSFQFIIAAKVKT